MIGLQPDQYGVFGCKTDTDVQHYMQSHYQIIDFIISMRYHIVFIKDLKRKPLNGSLPYKHPCCIIGQISQGIRQLAYVIHQVEINIPKNINILNTKRFQAKINKQFGIQPTLSGISD